MKSLLKALDVLELFLHSDDEVALADVARISKIPKTTVSRIVSTLVKRGYLKQKEKRGKYSLGTIYFEYTGLIKRRTRLRGIAIPHVLKLSQAINESVIIAYKNGLDNVDNIFVEAFHEKSTPNNLLRVVPDEGVSLSLHSSSLGKIILAGLSDEGLQRYLDSRVLTRHTPNTITQPDVLREHLLQVRQRGVAFDNEEYSLGVKGVAAGLKNGDGSTVGAIAVLAPSIRTNAAKLKELGPVVKNVAANISSELGFTQ